MIEFFGVYLKHTIFEFVKAILQWCTNQATYKTLKSESLCNTYFLGLQGRQTQEPPQVAHTLAKPLFPQLFPALL